MAITYVSNAEDTTTGSSPQTISVDIGTRTNGLLVVGVSGSVTQTFASFTATYGGVNMSTPGVYREAGGLFAILFYLADPADGANDLVLTWSVNSGGSISYKHTLASWYDGANQTQAAVLDQHNENTGATDPTLDITPGEAGELIVSQYVSKANDVLTVGADETEINNWDQGANVTGGSYAIQTSAATQTINWAGADDTWVMAVASFKAAASGTQYTQSVAGESTTAGTVVMSTRKPVAGGLTSAGALVNMAGKIVAGAITSAGTVLKTIGKPVAGALESAGVLAAVKTAFVALAGELTTAGALAMTTLKPLGGALGSSGELVRRVGKIAGGALNTAGEIVKRTLKTLDGAWTSEGALATVKAALVSLGGALTTSGSLALRTAKSLTGELTSAGNVVKRLARSLAGEFTTAGVISKTISRLVSGALTLAGTIATVLTGGQAATGTVLLTLSTRTHTLTLKARPLSLTLSTRPITLTVEDQ